MVKNTEMVASVLALQCATTDAQNLTRGEKVNYRLAQLV
ncbi:hypothetical protein SOHN41_01113 [Shewanella sp. HN-41]|nr:hypothetical protein SOHN41_01113 [Shewanella sp. HN-41]